MILEFQKLSEGHSVVEQDVMLDEEQTASSGVQASVSCRAEIDRVYMQIHMHVQFSCEVRLSCARCTTEFKKPIQGEYRLVLQNSVSRLPNEEIDFYFSDEDDQVDTRPALYDEIMTMIPLMPICNELCEGVEGAEKGGGAKETEEQIDPRWEALRKLKRE